MWSSTVFAFIVICLLQAASAVPVEKSPFIVGGDPADIADFPHQLALFDMVQGVQPTGYMCGASNIHRYWALTAAHCVEFETPAALLNLYGGSTSRLHGGHLFFVRDYHLHPGYDIYTWDLDIAIIEVQPSTPLIGFEHVSPIPIPPLCSTNCCGVCPDGPHVTVAGWGAIEDGSLPENLRQVSKGIMSLEACHVYWYDHPISHSKFCTIIEDGRDSCNGDSGSAVLRNGIQVGIVSFGSWPCGDGSVPAVYVRIEEPTVRNFIAQFVNV